MKIIPETTEDITTIIASEFRCFGGGNVSYGNPISMALRDQPPQFAAGVDVQDVVNRVIDLWIESRKFTTDPDNIDWSDLIDEEEPPNKKKR